MQFEEFENVHLTKTVFDSFQNLPWLPQQADGQSFMFSELEIPPPAHHVPTHNIDDYSIVIQKPCFIDWKNDAVAFFGGDYSGIIAVILPHSFIVVSDLILSENRTLIEIDEWNFHALRSKCWGLQLLSKHSKCSMHLDCYSLTIIDNKYYVVIGADYASKDLLNTIKKNVSDLEETYIFVTPPITKLQFLDILAKTVEVGPVWLLRSNSIVKTTDTFLLKKCPDGLYELVMENGKREIPNIYNISSSSLPKSDEPLKGQITISKGVNLNSPKTSDFKLCETYRFVFDSNRNWTGSDIEETFNGMCCESFLDTRKSFQINDETFTTRLGQMSLEDLCNDISYTLWNRHKLYSGFFFDKNTFQVKTKLDRHIAFDFSELNGQLRFMHSTFSAKQCSSNKIDSYISRTMPQNANTGYIDLYNSLKGMDNCIVRPIITGEIKCNFQATWNSFSKELIIGIQSMFLHSDEGRHRLLNTQALRKQKGDLMTLYCVFVPMHVDVGISNLSNQIFRPKGKLPLDWNEQYEGIEMLSMWQSVPDFATIFQIPKELFFVPQDVSVITLNNTLFEFGSQYQTGPNKKGLETKFVLRLIWNEIKQKYMMDPNQKITIQKSRRSKMLFNLTNSRGEQLDFGPGIYKIGIIRRNNQFTLEQNA